MSYFHHIAITPRTDRNPGNIAVISSVDFPADHSACPHIQAAVEMVAPELSVCPGKSVIGFYRYYELAGNLFLTVEVHTLVLGIGCTPEH